MICDCVKKVEAEVTALMVEKTGKEVAEPIKLSPKFLYSEKYPLYFKAAGKVQDGKGLRKFEVNITLTFCPFCGKKITEN